MQRRSGFFAEDGIETIDRPIAIEECSETNEGERERYEEWIAQQNEEASQKRVCSTVQKIPIMIENILGMPYRVYGGNIDHKHNTQKRSA